MGLLDNGMDMASLQQLAAQFGPNEDDRKRALLMSALTAGMGLLGVRRNHQGEDLSRLGMGTLGMYDSSLNESTKLRSQNLAQAMQYMQLQKQMQQMDMLPKIFDEKPQPVTGGVQPQAGISPRTASQFGAPSDTAGFQPMPAAPMQVPAGTNPQQVNGYTGPSPSEMPRELKAAIVASADPKEYAKYISDWSKVVTGTDGVARAPNGRPLYATTKQGITYFDQNGGTRFVPYDQAMLAAEAKQAGAIKGAETAATKAAEFPYSIVTATGSRGEPISGYAANVYGPPPVPGAAPAQPAQGNGPTLNFNGLTIPQAIAALKDAQQPGGPGANIGGGGSTSLGTGVVTGPSPVAQHAATAAIDTRENNKRSGYNAMVQNSQNQYEDIRKQFMSSRELDTHVSNMEKLDKEGVFTGPVQNWAGKWASSWNSAFPDAKINPQALANSETFQSEVSKMQQSIARTFPGSQSDRELVALTASLPTLMASAQGRAQIYDTLRRKIADSRETYRSASQYYKANDGNLIGWEPPPFTPPPAGYGAAPAAEAPTKGYVYNPKTRKVEPQ